MYELHNVKVQLWQPSWDAATQAVTPSAVDPGPKCLLNAYVWFGPHWHWHSKSMRGVSDTRISQYFSSSLWSKMSRSIS